MRPRIARCDDLSLQLRKKSLARVYLSAVQIGAPINVAGSINPLSKGNVYSGNYVLRHADGYTHPLCTLCDRREHLYRLNRALFSITDSVYWFVAIYYLSTNFLLYLRFSIRVLVDNMERFNETITDRI